MGVNLDYFGAAARFGVNLADLGTPSRIWVETSRFGNTQHDLGVNLAYFGGYPAGFKFKLEDFGTPSRIWGQSSLFWGGTQQDLGLN